MALKLITSDAITTGLLSEQSLAALQVHRKASEAQSISDGTESDFKPNSKELFDGTAPIQQYFLEEYAN